jgi:hypothetical protein
MRNHWTVGKFADWLRGTCSLGPSSSKEWATWHNLAKISHPFRYWLTETALDKAQDAMCYVPDRINDVRYYLNNRYTAKTHALTSTLKRGQWHEFGERLLYCSFDSYIDFLEIETAWSHVMWSDDAERAKYNLPWWREQWYTRWFAEWRCPEAAIAHLEWEMTLTNDNASGYETTNPKYNLPAFQAVAAKEKWALYYWWKYVRPQRVDPHEASGWSALCEQRRLRTITETGEDLWLWSMDDRTTNEGAESSRVLTASIALEKQYADEDEEMLVRLIKVRGNLWT